MVVTAPGEEDTQTDDYIVCGPLYKVTYTSGDQSFIEQVVIRPDIPVPDDKSDKVYIMWFHAATMMLAHPENILIQEAKGVLDIEDDLEDYLTPQDFLNKTTGSFNGTKCQIFYDHDDEEDVDIYFYADMDNFVLGYNYSTPNTQQTFTVSYDYTVGLQTFVLNKTLFDNCNDSRAYDRPMVNPCAPPTSSSSSSRTISVVLPKRYVRMDFKLC